MNYHMTKIKYLKEIIKSGGLSSQKIGANSDFVKDKKEKISFSKEMEGVIQITVSFQKRYDFEAEERGEITEDLNEILGPSVYLCFSEDLVLNERENMSNGKEDIADAFTTQDIPLESLSVCILKNAETGEISYDRDDIVKYMMSQTSVEEVVKDLPDRKYLEYIEHSDTLANYIREYYNQNEAILEEYRNSKYELEIMDVIEFYQQKINVSKSFEDRLKEGAPSQEEQADFAKKYNDSVQNNEQSIPGKESDFGSYVK